ncbi:hypothetical protein BPTFM16_00074 [Altererythrobacter insulae]|nr:hypothetical protein BPTFM16_00074 [Altererythrobacter insulae]
MRLLQLVAVPALVCISTPALADIPEPVQAMIDAAIATGDKAKVDTVIDLAKQTNPDDAAELDTIQQAFAEQVAKSEAAKAAKEEQAIRTASLFDNWSGKGELGGFRATGNSSNTGLTAALSLTREGIDWTQKLRARADYQRNNGVTSREQYFLAYEPNYNLSDRMFVYGLAQYERDRFQGFSGRYAVSGGIGYQIVDQPDLQISAKIGPAYRVTEFTNGETESRIAGLFGLDFDWSITDSLKLTHDTNAVAETGGTATVLVDSNNTSLNFVTGLNAKIGSGLSTRFSYAIEYDSNPPAGSEQTDTLSRVTLIYDF